MFLRRNIGGQENKNMANYDQYGNRLPDDFFDKANAVNDREPGDVTTLSVVSKSKSNYSSGSSKSSSKNVTSGGGGSSKGGSSFNFDKEAEAKKKAKEAAEKAAKKAKEEAEKREKEQQDLWAGIRDRQLKEADEDFATTKTELENTFGDLQKNIDKQKTDTENDYTKLESDIGVQKKEQVESFDKAASDLKSGLETDQKKLLTIFAARGTLHSSEFERVWAEATDKFQKRLTDLNTDESNQILKIDNTLNRYTQQKVSDLQSLEDKRNAAIRDSALALTKLNTELQRKKSITYDQWKQNKLAVEKDLSTQLYNIEATKQNTIQQIEELAQKQMEFRWQVQKDIADLALKQGALDISAARLDFDKLKDANAKESEMPDGYYAKVKDTLDGTRGTDGKADDNIFDSYRQKAYQDGYGTDFDKLFLNTDTLSEDALKARKSGTSPSVVTLPDGTKINI